MGNLDFLRGSRLTPVQILAGKVGGALAAMGSACIPTSLLCGVLLLCYPIKDHVGDSRGFIVAMAFLGAAAVIAVLGAACGLAGAVLARRTAGSVIVAYVLLASILWVVPYRWVVFTALTGVSRWDLGAVFGPSPTFRFAAFPGELVRETFGPYFLSQLVVLGISAVLFVLSLSRFRIRWMREH